MMQILFKLAVDTTATPQVFHTDFREFAPSVHRNMAWETLEPFIRDATRDYVIPHLGQAYYDELATAYNGDVALSEQQTKVLDLLRGAVAQYAVYDSLPGLAVRVSDMGPINTRDNEGTAGPASGATYFEARREAIRKADRLMDMLLDYLDELAKAGHAAAATYKTSDVYAAEGSDFFANVTEIDQYLNIRGSRRAYLSIVRYFREAEDRHVLPVLGQQFYDELKTQKKAGTLTAPNKKALAKVQRFAAKWGLWEAIPHISCVLGPDGIFVVSSTDSFSTKSNSNTIFGQAMIERIQQSAEEGAAKAHGELLDFLRLNIEDYTTYKDNRYHIDADKGILPYGAEEGGAIIF